MLDDELVGMINRLNSLKVKLEGHEFFSHCNSPMFNIDFSMKELVIIKILSADNSLTMSEISKRLGINVSTLTRAIDKLVSDKIVIRKADPSDRRMVRVNLTLKAKRMIEKIDREHTKEMISFIEVLPKEDVRKAMGLLESLVDILTGSHKQKTSG